MTWKIIKPWTQILNFIQWKFTKQINKLEFEISSATSTLAEVFPLLSGENIQRKYDANIYIIKSQLDTFKFVVNKKKKGMNTRQLYQ